MRRRTVLLGGAAGAMLAMTRGLAQPRQREPRIGVLLLMDRKPAEDYLAALRSHLATEGVASIRIERRSPPIAAGPPMEAARELAALGLDAILAYGTEPTLAAIAATRSTPIVFTYVSDPVRAGIVGNLARPGGNVTGTSNRFAELGAKRLEVLREALPAAKRVAAVAGFFDIPLEILMDYARPHAERMGLEVFRVEARNVGWPLVVRSALDRGADAIMVLTPFRLFGAPDLEQLVVAECLKLRAPAIFSEVDSVFNGAMMSYSALFDDEVRRAAALLAQVLRGRKPGELAVDLAAKFELAVNLKTAQAIGLKMPQSLLLRADRVIE